MNYTVTVITAPTVEPISLSEAKSQLRLTDGFTADDTYITALISVARDHAEKYCNRYFSEQTIALNYEGNFTQGHIKLPFPDVASVSSVKYIDSSGIEQTVDAADYTFSSERQTITYNVGFPFATSYRVELITGAPTEFEGAKQAMLMVLTDLYELRTETVVGASIAENPAVKALFYPYRVSLSV